MQINTTGIDTDEQMMIISEFIVCVSILSLCFFIFKRQYLITFQNVSFNVEKPFQF
jgi:hypothetical protein